MISVVIPTYNRAHTLPRTLDSLIQQTYSDWEAIVIDDGSTDTTPKILKDYSARDSRIKTLRQPNRGVNAARNRGIKQATHSLVSLLDSDDMLLPQALDIILQTHQDHPDYQVYGFMTKRTTLGGIKQRGFKPSKSWTQHTPTYEEVVTKKHIAGDIHYVLHKPSLSNLSFDEAINGFELAFFAQAKKQGAQFLYTNRVIEHKHDQDADHLSYSPWEKWPQEFARAYTNFLTQHQQVFGQHTHIRSQYYHKIAHCRYLAKKPTAPLWYVRAKLAQWFNL